MPDPHSDAFERALNEAGRGDNAPDDSGPRATPGARIRGVAFGPTTGSGGKARFGLALDWTDEPTDRLTPQPPPSREPVRRFGDTSIDIATELGFDSALTLDQLTSRWRDFVWHNHPDRQPLDAREGANARVAMANTLYDRERRERAKAR
jgi:hypothetical protein